MTTLQKTIKLLKKHMTSTLKGLDFSERVLGGRTQNPIVLMRSRGTLSSMSTFSVLS